MMIANNEEFTETASSTAALRQLNREALIRLIARSGAMTRGDLAAKTGLTPAAISRITREMLDAGFLQEGVPIRAQGRAGRRESLLSINPDGTFALAISLTANRRDIALVNGVGEALSSIRCNDLEIADAARFLDEMATRAKTLVYDADVNRGRLLGVGVSAAISMGHTDMTEIDLITSDPLGWRNVAVRKTLADALELPVKVEHRASAILRAEIKRRAQSSNIFLINNGLGMGVSAYFNNRVVKSGSGGLGSLSHLSAPGDETVCGCGRRGCLDAIASGRAILTELGQVDCPLPIQALRLEDAVASADAGDARTCSAFRNAGRRLGFGVEAAFSLLNPDLVILSGEVGRQSDYRAGLFEALEKSGRRALVDRIEASAVTSTEAAIGVALDAFVLTGGLNLTQLKAA